MKKIWCGLLVVAGLSPFSCTGCPASSKEHLVRTTRPADPNQSISAAIPGMAELGEKIGKPIQDRIVIIDGVYIRPPYVVSRRGACVYINDVLWWLDSDWPYVRQKDIAVDPGPPIMEGLTTDSGFDKYLNKDSKEGWHGYIKMMYLNKQYAVEKGWPRRKVAEELAAYYRQLPCIKEAKVCDNNDEAIMLTQWNGDQIGKDCVVSPKDIFSGQLPDETLNRMIKEDIEKTMDQEKTIKNNYTTLFLSEGDNYRGWHGMTKEDAIRTLPLIYEILQSERPRAEKLSLLIRIGTLCDSSSSGQVELLHDLYNKSKANKASESALHDLMSRLGELRRANPQIVPMTLRDIPDVATWEKEHGRSIREMIEH